MRTKILVLLGFLGAGACAQAAELPQAEQWQKLQRLNTTRQSITEIPAGTDCNYGDPEALSLEERVAWGRNTSRCLEELAEAEKLASQALAASDPKNSVQGASVAATRTALAEEIEAGAREAEAQGQFLGLNWGIGLGVSQLFDDAIEEAAVVDGVVRVTKESQLQPRVLLEFHRFFFSREGGKDPGTNNQAIKTGHGPFVAVAATDDNVLAGIAAGWMWGWKDFRLPATDDAFTVGIGLILDDDIKDLADGFDEDKPLPEGETDIRFEEKARVGVVLLFTRSF
jgi:hypothetical protein